MQEQKYGNSKWVADDDVCRRVPKNPLRNWSEAVPPKKNLGGFHFTEDEMVEWEKPAEVGTEVGTGRVPGGMILEGIAGEMVMGGVGGMAVVSMAELTGMSDKPANK